MLQNQSWFLHKHTVIKLLMQLRGLLQSFSSHLLVRFAAEHLWLIMISTLHKRYQQITVKPPRSLNKQKMNRVVLQLQNQSESDKHSIFSSISYAPIPIGVSQFVEEERKRRTWKKKNKILIPKIHKKTGTAAKTREKLRKDNLRVTAETQIVHGSTKPDCRWTGTINGGCWWTKWWHVRLMSPGTRCERTGRTDEQK